MIIITIIIISIIISIITWTARRDDGWRAERFLELFLLLPIFCSPVLEPHLLMSDEEESKDYLQIPNYDCFLISMLGFT